MYKMVDFKPCAYFWEKHALSIYGEDLLEVSMHRDLTFDRVDLCEKSNFSYKCHECGGYTKDEELEGNSGFCDESSDILFTVGYAGVAAFLVGSFEGEKYRLCFKMPRTRENYYAHEFFFGEK